MKSLGLDIDWDLALDDSGDLVLLNESQEVKQHMRQRLLCYYGEWFLDRSIGVPWFQDILTKPYNSVRSEGIIKRTILKTDGVSRILNFDTAYDPTNRYLMYGNVNVLTTYAESEYLEFKQ